MQLTTSCHSPSILVVWTLGLVMKLLWPSPLYWIIRSPSAMFSPLSSALTQEVNPQKLIDFCVGFPHTLSGAAIFLSLFIYLYTSAKSFWPGVSEEERGPWEWVLCVVAFTRLGSVFRSVVSWRIIWTCFLAAISLQGKEKSSSLLTFLYCIEWVVPAIIF